MQSPEIDMALRRYALAVMRARDASDRLATERAQLSINTRIELSVNKGAIDEDEHPDISVDARE